MVVGDIRGPAIGGRDGCVEDSVGVDELLRAGVVEVGEGALFELLGCGFVAGDRALGIARNWLVQPFQPFGRVEPAVAQFDQPPWSPGNGDGGQVAGVFSSGKVGRWPVREREGLQGGGGRVTRAVFQAGSKP